jgi:hypothetical protein
VLGASLGFMKDSTVDPRTEQVISKREMSLFLTMASASYRIKYVPALGMYWYVDLAQIYDIKHGLPGSQVGFSLSKR